MLQSKLYLIFLPLYERWLNRCRPSKSKHLRHAGAEHFSKHMARIHVHTHGKSHSTRPSSKGAPSWLTQNRDEISALVVKMAKEGLSPSEIGLAFRDEHGIPLVKPILGKGVTRILVENNIKSDMPEDLDKLVKKALGLQRHLKVHNSDHRNVRSLELIESKIHRLSNYYKRADRIPKNWKYAAVIAQLE
jgi:small subunit ribosomal protein S15